MPGELAADAQPSMSDSKVQRQAIARDAALVPAAAILDDAIRAVRALPASWQARLSEHLTKQLERTAREVAARQIRGQATMRHELGPALLAAIDAAKALDEISRALQAERPDHDFSLFSAAKYCVHALCRERRPIPPGAKFVWGPEPAEFNDEHLGIISRLADAAIPDAPADAMPHAIPAAVSAAVSAPPLSPIASQPPEDKREAASRHPAAAQHLTPADEAMEDRLTMLTGSEPVAACIRIDPTGTCVMDFRQLDARGLEDLNSMLASKWKSVFRSVRAEMYKRVHAIDDIDVYFPSGIKPRMCQDVYRSGVRKLSFSAPYTLTACNLDAVARPTAIEGRFDARDPQAITLAVDAKWIPDLMAVIEGNPDASFFEVAGFRRFGLGEAANLALDVSVERPGGGQVQWSALRREVEDAGPRQQAPLAPVAPVAPQAGLASAMPQMISARIRFDDAQSCEIDLRKLDRAGLAELNGMRFKHWERMFADLRKLLFTVGKRLRDVNLYLPAGLAQELPVIVYKAGIGKLSFAAGRFLTQRDLDHVPKQTIVEGRFDVRAPRTIELSSNAAVFPTLRAVIEGDGVPDASFFESAGFRHCSPKTRDAPLPVNVDVVQANGVRITWFELLEQARAAG